MKIYDYKPNQPKPKPIRENQTEIENGIFKKITMSNSSSKSTSRLANLSAKLPWVKIGTWAFRIAAAGTLVLAILFIYFSKNLPDPNRLLGRNVPESTKIYAKDETLLYEVHGEIKRTLVNLEDISPDLKNATIAIEDKNFYKHAGISITGIARSIFVDITSGQKKQGGSTITQQFVKNAVLTRDKSFYRKLKEIILSIELEARFSKDDILKLYLNEIPYGRNAYGIQAASETYFAKNASDLTLAESAYLAALPQAPSFYNPSGANFDALQNRQKRILGLMKEQGYIDEAKYQTALEEKVEFKQITTAIKAPHFVQYVQQYLGEKYGEQTLQEGGFKVYTTLDVGLQEKAEQIVKEGAEKNAAQGGYNAALVAIDPRTGQILAMVGSKDYFGENFPKDCNPKTCLFSPNVNIATTLQQPGSSFKPYAYLTAFGRDHKYAPSSMLVDVVTNFGNYTPKNFNLSQNGPVSMRKALAGSLNIPAVKTIALVGEENVIKTARDLGINSEFKDCGLSLVLGGCDITLLDHTAAYATLANQGKKIDKTAILKIVSQDGSVLEEYKRKETKVIDEQAVYELTDIMSDNSARSYVFGSDSPLQLGERPVAAKTGTTQDFRDGWTMGFTPSIAVGVWTGNNNNASMKKDAVFMAGPIWNKFMKSALEGTPIEKFDRPEGIKEVVVDAVSGKLPTQYTPQTKTDIFADYSVPTEKDNIHVPVKVDILTGLPASDETPPEQIKVEIYKALRSEKPNNPAWEQPVIAWALTNGYKYPPGSGIQNPTPTPANGTIGFIAPAENTTIKSFPMNIALNVSSGVLKVELSLDGQNIYIFNQPPYNYQIIQTLDEGEHTLTATAYYGDGKQGSSTVKFIVNTSIEPTNSTTPTPTNNNQTSGLQIITPESGKISLPTEISVKSNKKLSSVTFYIESGGQTKNIGSAAPQTVSANEYQYSLVWTGNNSSPGDYKVYAKSGSLTTSKVSVTVK